MHFLFWSDVQNICLSVEFLAFSIAEMFNVILVSGKHVVLGDPV